MTNVQVNEMTVTVKMRTGVGPYRRGELVTTDPETAAGWMSANLADLMPIAPASPIIEAIEATAADIRDRHRLDTSEGNGDGATQRAAGAGKPRRRAAARDAVVDGIHGVDDAGSTKHLKGTNPGRSGDSAS